MHTPNDNSGTGGEDGETRGATQEHDDGGPRLEAVHGTPLKLLVDH